MFLGGLLKAVIDTASLPVQIVKDVATLGGACLGEQETYTGKKLREIGKDIEEAKDDL
jgi:hypothetical protein